MSGKKEQNGNGTTHKMDTQPTSTSTSTSSTRIPDICQYWRSMANSLPVITIGGLNVSMTLASAVVLTLVRYSAEYSMIYGFGWPSNALITKNAAASVAAIFHSLQLVPALGACFANTDGRPYNPSQRLSEAAVWWQETVTALIQFCTGYMIYDGLLNIVWLKTQMSEGRTLTSEDYMFLGHHVATILYMTSTRIVKSGHQSAMMCMLLGELTNPLHNAFYVAQFAQTLDCCNGVFSQLAYQIIKVAFAALYCLVRVVIGPFVFVHITYHTVMVGRKHIPLALIVFWNLLIWAVIVGSIPWVQECWNNLQPYLPASIVGRTSQGQEL
jgi:TLC domain